MLLKLLENIFRHFVEIRNNSFQSNKIEQFFAKIPVISIGNISVGGSGKTPFTIELAKLLLGNGIRPAIIGRGYKRKSTGGIIVSDGKQILSNAEESGDEMLLIAQKVKVPVVLHQKKYKAAQIVEENFNIDVILVDDGFQHRKLFRNLDIVIIDSKTIEKPFLLPRGRLREPLNSLSRADIICIYSENDYAKISDYIRKDAEVFVISIENNGIFNLEDYSSLSIATCETSNEDEKKNNEILQFVQNDKDLALNDKISVQIDSENNYASLSSIANPERFINSIRNFKIKYNIKYKDHHHYTKKNIEKIIKFCKQKEINYIITTEKDSVKLHKFNELFKSNSIFIYVFSIKIDIFNFQKLTDIVLKTFHNNKKMLSSK